MKISFDPPLSLQKFWLSDDFYQFIIGPIGSTKTTNVIMKLLSVAASQAPAPDGIRYTRFVLARQTLPQLKTTVLTDIQQWFREIITYKVAESKIEIRVGDIHSDWYLLPLAEVEDQRRLLSMQLTMVYFNEFRELPLELVAAAAGRVGRYPSMQHGGCTYAGVWGDSNPPSENSEWHKFLVREPPSNLTYVHQPGAFDPECDWRQYLRPNYYENLMQGHNQDWVDVHIHSKWGPDVSGQAVFRNSFRESRHVVDQLFPTTQRPFVIGLDVGRNPGAVVGQADARGSLLVCSSIHEENMGIEKFLTTCLKPHLNELYPGGRFFAGVDPAARARSQIGEESVLDAIKRMGLVAILAPTNDISPRLRAVEKPMLLDLDGKPGLMIDKRYNQALIRALSYEYRFTRNKNNTLAEIPEKQHPWSDLVDALGYFCLCVNSPVVARTIRQSRPDSGPTRAPSAAGWT